MNLIGGLATGFSLVPRPSPAPVTASDQKLEAQKAWEQGYTGSLHCQNYWGFVQITCNHSTDLPKIPFSTAAGYPGMGGEWPRGLLHVWEGHCPGISRNAQPEPHLQSTPGKTVLCLAQQFYITETGAAVVYCNDALFSGPYGPAHLFVTCSTSKAGWGPESKDIVIVLS